MGQIGWRMIWLLGGGGGLDEHVGRSLGLSGGNGGGMVVGLIQNWIAQEIVH